MDRRAQFLIRVLLNLTLINIAFPSLSHWRGRVISQTEQPVIKTCVRMIGKNRFTLEKHRDVSSLDKPILNSPRSPGEPRI